MKHDIWNKPLFSTKDALSVLPGTGHGVLRSFRAAGWLSPIGSDKRAFYKSADVRAALERLEAGEKPEALAYWGTAIGGGSHLVLGGDPSQGTGRAACGAKATAFLLGVQNERFRCTKCQHAAKGRANIKGG